jgi:predicted O-methyltransferase YrrM
MKILDFSNIENLKLKFNSEINFINSNISHEMRVIASIANVSKKILEIGSGNAINTLLFSMNSSDNTSISLLTLINERLLQRAYQYNDQSTEIFPKEDNEENSCEDLIFEEVSYNSKIIFLEKDFFKNEHLNFKNNFDLIFIDFENFSDISIDSGQFLIDLLSKEGILLIKDHLNNSTDFTGSMSLKKEICKIDNTSLFFIKN